jgi:NmrA-like family
MLLASLSKSIYTTPRLPALPCPCSSKKRLRDKIAFLLYTLRLQLYPPNISSLLIHLHRYFTMTTVRKLIVVVGATGNQGSSVAKQFLTLGNWHVRAVTRDPSSPAAQALASAGAQVVKADLSDPTSLSIVFDGAHAIFVNTDFWGHYLSLRAGTEEEKQKNGHTALGIEIQNGKNAAIAAASVPTLERYVYSALGPMKKVSNGKYYRSHHWNSKAAVVEYIETELPDLAKKASFIYLGAYANNRLINPKVDPVTGIYKFVFPFKKELKMPVILHEESTGKFVQALIENEDPGTKLLAYNIYPTLGDITEIWSKVSGKTADIVEITPEIMHEQSGLPWEVLEGALYLPEYGYMAGVDGFIEPSQLKVPVQIRSFEDYLKEQRW